MDKKHRLFRQQYGSKSGFSNFPLQFRKHDLAVSHHWKVPTIDKINFEQLHQKLITREYNYPSVIINKNADVLHSTGGISQYLNYTEGAPSRKILEMIVPDLRQPLRNVLFRIKHGEADLPVRKKLQINMNGKAQVID